MTGAVLAQGSDLPIGQLAVGVEPDLARTMTYAIMRPWRKVQDTIVYNEGLLLDALSQAIINRRLEARARAGGSYLVAQVGQDDVSRSTDATFVSVRPLTNDWQASLADKGGMKQKYIFFFFEAKIFMICKNCPKSFQKRFKQILH